MNPDQPSKPVNNPLSVMHENEQVLCEIRRHPIGILGVYVSTAVIVIGSIAAAFIIPQYATNLTTQNKEALAFAALILSVIALLYCYIARVVYTGNRWILTDDSLTQVMQDGLFRKHSSQLSLANLEDVTAEQTGVLQAMFGYGTLRAETAGERSKFVFWFCPKPNDYARQILQARESFITNEPGQAKLANDKLNVPQQAAVQQPIYAQPLPPQPVSQQPAYVPPFQQNPVPGQPAVPTDQGETYPTQGNSQ